MALNPYFLQGSAGEQYLMQDLVNEQLRIYGIDVYYMPRKILGREKFSNEVIMSKFDDNFIIEAYLNNFEGYGDSTNIMTKFGLELKDEISLTISEERWQTFIEPFLEDLQENDSEETILTSRPREGDVIYFPLGERMFEIKYVEHENPFFQLGKNYVYELKCELLQLSDSEIIETSVEAIDDNMEDYGYVTTINLVAGIGSTAVGVASTAVGGIQFFSITNDGYDYTSAPTVSISTAPSGGINATAVATLNGGSISTVFVTNAGAGYTEPPTVTFTGGGGTGAAATATISDGVLRVITLSGVGSSYTLSPTITITGAATSTAVAEGVVGSGGSITEIRFTNTGFGYTADPTIAFNTPASVGVGTFEKNETVTGSLSGTTAKVKKYDENDNYLEVYINSGNFTPGEVITGSASSATRTVSSYNNEPEQEIEFSQNLDIEEFADDILDFTESNPFGTF